MVTQATEDERRRNAARSHGVLSAACPQCAWWNSCGGIQPERPLLEDCFDLYCCHNPTKCDDVCPYNSAFARRMEEVGGLRFSSLPALTQTDATLPRYIPLIHHAYCHRRPLDLECVALETYQVFRLRDGQYRSLAQNAAELREEFGLAPNTQIILRGTARDPSLERFWSYRRRDAVAEQMRMLGIMMAIAPNFSHFLDVVRPDNLFNRKRQLICIGELAAAGICVVPHLSAVTSDDWRFWRDYLEQNDKVRFIAIEFQTGNKNHNQGRLVIQRVTDIQEATRRRLHPIVIGGTQYARHLAERFETFTLIDSCPFMKAVKRQRFEKRSRGAPWTATYTLENQGIEDVILKNVKGHTEWIDEQCKKQPQLKGA